HGGSKAHFDAGGRTTFECRCAQQGVGGAAHRHLPYPGRPPVRARFLGGAVLGSDQRGVVQFLTKAVALPPSSTVSTSTSGKAVPVMPRRVRRMRQSRFSPSISRRLYCAAGSLPPGACPAAATPTTGIFPSAPSSW